MLREISQRKISSDLAYIWNLKKNPQKTNQICRYIETTLIAARDGRWWVGKMSKGCQIYNV